MDAYQIPEDKIIKVELTGAAGLLKPVVYIDGKYYCVLLGIDPEIGVFGRGRTLEKALAEWDKQLQAHLKSNDDEDYIVAHIKNILYPPKKRENIQEFYDQFKPGKPQKKDVVTTIKQNLFVKQCNKLVTIKIF